MKVKTLRDNVGTLNKKGTILEVSEQEGKRLIKLGVVEEVKEKKATKKTKKDGE